jgi:hypothetical protein
MEKFWYEQFFGLAANGAGGLTQRGLTLHFMRAANVQLPHYLFCGATAAVAPNRLVICWHFIFFVLSNQS